MTHFYVSGQSLVAITSSVLLLCTALWAPAVEAKVLRVTTCYATGPGSLTDAVAKAKSGDLITLKELTCDRIQLGRQIDIPQASLTLVGNGRLTVDGNGSSRVFYHSGTGTLRIKSMAVANGFVSAAEAFGGCIYSSGRVELSHSRVHHCIADFRPGTSPLVAGGGIFANGGVLVSHSKVFSNSSDPAADGYGGGIYSGGPVRIFRSKVYDNQASLGGGIFAFQGLSVVYSRINANHAVDSGGGIAIDRGGVTINKSTISGNRAGVAGAITIYWRSPSPDQRMHIMDSTISGNVATERSVGYLAADTTISNSTVAFNHAESTDGCFGALQAPRLHLESSILSNNSCASGRDYDIGGSLDHTVVGANNIVGQSLRPLPADTIFSDPRLGPLADNGGRTPTHALGRGSPAINAGNNAFDRKYDQRGPGFPRIRGLRPDIGAVEHCGRVRPHDPSGDR